MKYVSDSSTDEVISEWLKAELHSSRFGDDLKLSLKKAGQNESIINNPNLNNSSENEQRLKILNGYSWLDFDLYGYRWTWVELSQDAVRELHYIDYSYWNELSDNTRLIGRAAQNVQNGKVVFDVPHDRFYAVAEDVENGKELPPIILISHGESEPAEVIEGHLRSTGYVLANKVSHPLRGILGILAA